MRKYGTYCQLGFSSEIEVARLGIFIARLELDNTGSGSSLLSSPETPEVGGQGGMCPPMFWDIS